MNKLITTNNGGFPFHLDDVRFLDDAYRDSINAILSQHSDGSAASSFIVSGIAISISGTVITASAGWIYISGELLYFPGGTLDHGSFLNIYFGLEVVDGESRVFEDGSSNNVHQTRQAKMYAQAVPSSGWYEVAANNLSNIRRLNNLVAQSLEAEQEGLRVVGTSGQPAYGGTASSTGSGAIQPLCFHKDSFGHVHVQGYFRNTGQWSVIFTLPVGYRPSNSIYISLRRANGISGNSDMGYLEVKSNGEVVAGMPYNNGAITANDVVVMNSSFKTA